MKKSKTKQKYTVASLFSGCGGLDLGFDSASFEIQYAVDNDPLACDVYRRNLGEHIRCMDVTNDEFFNEIRQQGTCDVLLGGFPCQGFSKAGPKKKSDPRNQLYRSMLYAAEHMKPSVIVAENVDGILQNFKGEFFRTICKDFEDLGYLCEPAVIDAAWYGVSQHRRRVFFVFTSAELPRFQFPEATHEKRLRNGEFAIPTNDLFSDATCSSARTKRPISTISDAIEDLLIDGQNVPDHVYEDSWPAGYNEIFSAIGEGQKLCNVRHAETSVYTWQIPQYFGEVTDQEVLVLETLAKNRRKKIYGDIPNGNPIPADELERLSGVVGCETLLERLADVGYVKRKSGGYDLKGAMFCSGLFKRPRWDEPSPTVLTNFNNPRYFLHPSEARPFTLRECARLQGFPDDFLFDSHQRKDIAGLYRLVGNAVAPPVARKIADGVYQFLNDYS
ncbi:DNA cytosine methyltransferase [Pseudomonadales bacterium]|nr:DNA cytosine methyltransferase [Pseudomonadales bacterium]